MSGRKELLSAHLQRPARGLIHVTAAIVERESFDRLRGRAKSSRQSQGLPADNPQLGYHRQFPPIGAPRRRIGFCQKKHESGRFGGSLAIVRLWRASETPPNWGVPCSGRLDLARPYTEHDIFPADVPLFSLGLSSPS
jgi:hypothetical protein